MINRCILGSAIAVLLFLTAPPASASKPTSGLYGLSWSGEDFLKDCRPGRKGRSRCLGYVMGLSDGIAVFQGAMANGRASYAKWKPICAPDSVTGEDLVATLIAYLDAHPDKRQGPVVVLFTRAIRKAWPCDNP